LLTDPFKIPVSSGTDVTVHTLPLVGVGIDSSIYTSSDFRSGGVDTRGTQVLLNHQYNKRFRHTLRLNTLDRDSDGLTDSTSIILIVDQSPAPLYSPAVRVAGLVHTILNGFSTAVSGTTDPAAVHQDFIDFLNGES